MITILIVFLFIAFKMMSICWVEKSSKSTRTRTTTTTAVHNEQNGTTKLTNHSNNLLIISSYNGSLTKVSRASSKANLTVMDVSGDCLQLILIVLPLSPCRKTDLTAGRRSQHGLRRQTVSGATSQRSMSSSMTEIPTWFPHIINMVIINNSMNYPRVGFEHVEINPVFRNH